QLIFALFFVFAFTIAIIYMLHTLRARFDVLHTKDVSLYTIRHFKEDSADALLKSHELILEQRTETTLQLVMK
ncbi:MAG: hypothetical protein ACPGFK_05870, partial [Flavobacteriaceae bacterium]